MMTNESVKRLATSLLMENAQAKSFTVKLGTDEDSERVAVELEQMGCRIERPVGPGCLTTVLRGDNWDSARM